jgi:hypothetical protein
MTKKSKKDAFLKRFMTEKVAFFVIKRRISGVNQA